MSIFYTRKFYDRDFERTSRSAGSVVPYLLRLLATGGGPKSVIDIGCGRGVWLKAFEAAGIADVEGRDGAWTDRSRLLIEAARFQAVDLTGFGKESRRFDLAMTLEVAEHLEQPHAERFVGSMADLSDTILFSAAIPGQGGQHHVNEQRLSYWQDLFQRRDYALFDIIRPQFWDNADVCWWYRQNMVVFANRHSPWWEDLQDESRKRAPIVDLAHPEGFRQKARLANIFSPEEYIGTFSARLKRRVLG